MRDLISAGSTLDLRSLPGSVVNQVADTLEAADQAGSSIEFVGLAPVFREIRVYRGIDREWILAPAYVDPVYIEHGGRLPVPGVNLKALKRLVASGIEFPEVFLAHDAPLGSVGGVLATTTQTTDLVPMRGMQVISPEQAREIVRRPGPHARTIELARRCGQVSQGLIRAYAAAAAMAGALVAVAAAPLLFVGTTGGGAPMETVGIDPILFGAVPVKGRGRRGQSAWFVVSEWNY